MQKIDTETNAVYCMADYDQMLVSAEERRIYLDAVMRIAETAIRESFGKLSANDVGIVTSIRDKNEAMFLEWLGR